MQRTFMPSELCNLQHPDNGKDGPWKGTWVPFRAVKKRGNPGGRPLVHVNVSLAQIGPSFYTESVSRSIGSSSRILAACSLCFL